MKRVEKCTVFVYKQDDKINSFKVKLEKVWRFQERMKKKRNVSHCAIILHSSEDFYGQKEKCDLTPIEWKVGDTIELTGFQMSF